MSICFESLNYFWIYETCMSIYLCPRLIPHILSTLPILWNKCIKSEIMAISFAWTWKSSEFILGLFFPVLPGSSPVGNPSEPYHPELPWDLIGCRSDAAKVVLIMFSSRVATRWSEEGGSNYTWNKSQNQMGRAVESSEGEKSVKLN